MVFTLSDAARRSWRAGREPVDTVDLLVVIAGRLTALRNRLAHVLPRLRDEGAGRPSGLRIGEPPARLPGREESTRLPIGFETAATLREATWQARRRLRRRAQEPAPAWSSGIAAAVETALAEAGTVGVTHAHAGHLLLGVLADPNNRACRLLAEIGVDTEALADAVPWGADLPFDPEPLAQSTTDLRLLGVLASPQPPVVRGLGRLLRAVRPNPGGPILFAVRREAVRQAVRMGDQQVGQDHLLIALCALAHDLRATGQRLADPLIPVNSAVYLLSERGVEYPVVAAQAAQLAREDTAVDTRRWRPERADPPYAVDFISAADLAMRYVKGRDPAWLGTTHLLMALLSFPKGAATRVLRACDVDTRAMAELVSGELGVAGPEGAT
jgi:hypothetical protein